MARFIATVSIPEYGITAGDTLHTLGILPGKRIKCMATRTGDYWPIESRGYREAIVLWAMQFELLKN